MVRIGDDNMPYFAISTVFGWIVAGRALKVQKGYALVTTDGVEEILHKIWAINDVQVYIGRRILRAPVYKYYKAFG